MSINPYAQILVPKHFYPKDINRQVYLYSLDKESNEAQVIGSLSYRSGNASDVDLFEEVFRNNKKDVITFFTVNIKKIVKDLQGRKKQYFLEVKLGLDHLYSDIEYGMCANDQYVVSDSFFYKMKDYSDSGFITQEEYNVIKEIQDKIGRDQIDYETIKALLRKRSVLRWNAREIGLGYKKLINKEGNKYKYTIEEGVQEKSQINIEGIFINADNKYVDCSNFFVLEYNDNNHKHHMLNLSDDVIYNEPYFRQDNLKQSMYTLMYSKLNQNLFKVLKRMLSYGKMSQNVDLIEKVYGLINSQMGMLYNFVSQLKTLSKIAKEHESKYMYKTTLYHVIESIGFKLQELIFVDYDFTELTELINLVLSKDKTIKESEFAKIVDEITHHLLDFINQQTKKEMIKKGLYPLPEYLMPDPKPF